MGLAVKGLHSTFLVRSFVFSLGSFGALRQISDVKTLNRPVLAATVFIQFQPTCMESMVIRGKYRLLPFFGNPPKIKKFYGTLKFLLTHVHMGLEISKHYSSYSFHSMSVKFYEVIGYHGGIQAVTILGN